MRHGLPASLLPLVLLVFAACAESPIGDGDLDAALDNTWTVDATVLLGPDGSLLEPDLQPDLRPDDLQSGMVEIAQSARDAAAASASDAGSASDAHTAPAPELDAKVAPTSMDAATAEDVALPREAAMMPPTCSEPQRSCNGRCIDVRDDPQNCGACGRRCASGESCVESRCWGEPPQSCSSKAFEGHAYLFCTQSRNWSQARKVCLDAAMDLTIVGDVAENDFVRAAGNDIWLGANDLQTEGTFTWVPAGTANRNNGAALDYKNWPQGEPNNTKRCGGPTFGDRCLGGEIDEDCAMASADGRWNDTNCAEERRFVCEAY